MIMENAKILASDKYSEKCGKSSNSPAVRYAYRLRLNLIAEVLRTRSGCNSLLDLGSGSGDYAADLVEETGLTPCLLDISDKRLLVASHKGRRILCVQADAVAIPFCDNAFDFVLVMNSLRYFSSAGCALLECRRVLRHGGFLLVMDHNKLSPEVMLLGRERTRCFTVGTLLDLIRTSHFKVITTKMLFILPPFTPSFLVSIIAKVGQFLTPMFGKVYAEIFVLAAKE